MEQKVIRKPLLILSLICASTALFAQAKAPSHKLFDNLLKIHVSESGKVDYKGFIKDSAKLDEYLDLLSKNAPSDSWTKNEIKAFWINAYNAFTIKLIMDNYPVKSIKDIGGSIYKINTSWDIQFIKIGNQTYDLNNIEHAKLRRQFEDPRIHFAIVCASKSCPKLFNEAYEAARLDAQLDRAGKEFLRDPFRNKITASKIQISSIFNWYKGDFTEEGTLIEFLNKFAPVKINANASISYLDYDWTLNE